MSRRLFSEQHNRSLKERHLNKATMRFMHESKKVAAWRVVNSLAIFGATLIATISLGLKVHNKASEKGFFEMVRALQEGGVGFFSNTRDYFYTVVDSLPLAELSFALAACGMSAYFAFKLSQSLTTFKVSFLKSLVR